MSKNYIINILTLRCPKCREGNIFKTSNSYNLNQFLQMNEECTICKQKTELEIGFYYGTGYVSYAITIAASVITFIAWWITIGFSLYNNSILYWVITNGLLLILSQPYLMRLSRTIWLSWFVKYDKNWKTNKL